MKELVFFHQFLLQCDFFIVCLPTLFIRDGSFHCFSHFKLILSMGLLKCFIFHSHFIEWFFLSFIHSFKSQIEIVNWWSGTTIVISAFFLHFFRFVYICESVCYYYSLLIFLLLPRLLLLLLLLVLFSVMRLFKFGIFLWDAKVNDEVI